MHHHIFVYTANDMTCLVGGGGVPHNNTIPVINKYNSTTAPQNKTTPRPIIVRFHPPAQASKKLKWNSSIDDQKKERNHALLRQHLEINRHNRLGSQFLTKRTLTKPSGMNARQCKCKRKKNASSGGTCPHIVKLDTLSSTKIL